MAALGELERSVMELLWRQTEPVSAAELRDLLPRTPGSKELAVTTILTVFSRLERKGLVSRERKTRPHRYFAKTSREQHTAELMHEVLGTAPDREAVLARFLGTVSEEEASALRKLLERQ